MAARSRPGLSCGGGGCLGGAALGRGLTRIFSIAVGGHQLRLRRCAGPPGPRLWWCRLSGQGRPGARSRPDLCYCGRFASVELRGCVGPPGSRSRGSQSGPGCGARSSPYLCLIVLWASDGPEPLRGLAGLFVVVVGGVRVGLCVCEDSSFLCMERG